MFEKRTLIAVGFLVVTLADNVVIASEGGEGQVSLFSGNLGNFIWTLLIFSVVVVVLRKYAWGPILRNMQKRESFIHQSLASAQRDRQEAEARLQEYLQKLNGAQQEAASIVEAGRSEGDKQKQQIEEQAREHAEQALKRAKREIDTAHDDALKELCEQASHLALGMAGKMLERQLSPEDHNRLVQEALAEVRRRSDIQN